MMTSSPKDRINLDNVPDGAEIDLDALSRSIRTGPRRNRPSLRKAVRHAAIVTGVMLLALSLVLGVVYAAAQFAKSGTPDAVVARFLALTRDGDVPSARGLCIPTVPVSVRDFEKPTLSSIRMIGLSPCVAMCKRLRKHHKKREQSLGPFWQYILGVAKQNRLCVEELQMLIALDIQSPTSILENPHLHVEIAEVRVRASIRRGAEPYYRRGDFVFRLVREQGKGEWRLLSIR